MDTSVIRWALLATSVVVIILGSALAVVSLGGLGVIDRIVAGEADVAEAQAYDSLWQTILLVLLPALFIDGLLRSRWITAWLSLQGVSRQTRGVETAWRLEKRPQLDRRLFTIGSALSFVALAGIGVALVVSVLLPDGDTPIRLSSIAKAVAGAACAASSIAFAALVLRNRTFAPVELTRRRPPGGV